MVSVFIRLLDIPSGITNHVYDFMKINVFVMPKGGRGGVHKALFLPHTKSLHFLLIHYI